MRIGRILIAAIAAAVFSSVVSFVTCGWLLNWVYRLEPVNVWKPMEGPPGPMLYIGGLVLSLVFILVYAVFSKGIPGKFRPVKGFVFGLCVWAVGIVPGMFSLYSFTNIATTVIIYWTILGLVRTPLQGIIVALICDVRR